MPAICEYDFAGWAKVNSLCGKIKVEDGRTMQKYADSPKSIKTSKNNNVLQLECVFSNINSRSYDCLFLSFFVIPVGPLVSTKRLAFWTLPLAAQARLSECEARHQWGSHSSHLSPKSKGTFGASKGRF